MYFYLRLINIVSKTSLIICILYIINFRPDLGPTGVNELYINSTGYSPRSNPQLKEAEDLIDSGELKTTYLNHESSRMLQNNPVDATKTNQQRSKHRDNSDHNESNKKDEKGGLSTDEAETWNVASDSNGEETSTGGLN